MTSIHVDENICTLAEFEHSAMMALRTARRTESKAHIDISEFAFLTTERAIREGTEEVYKTAINAHAVAIEYYEKILNPPKEELQTTDAINARAVFYVRKQFYEAACQAHRRALAIGRVLADKL